MADALCGPSNALQNFQKHSSVDRTLQQDRLTSRHSPAQGFRSSPGPNAGILDHEFDAFQAGHTGPPQPDLRFAPPQTFAPQFAQAPQAPDWASDFQRLNISPSFAAPIQQHRPPQVSNAAASWHQDFMGQQASMAQAPAQQNNTFGSMSGHGMPWTGPSFQQRPGFGVMHGSQVSETMQGQQRAQEGVPQFDEAAFERAFEQAQQDALEETKSQRPKLPDYQAQLKRFEAQNVRRLVASKSQETDPVLSHIKEKRLPVYMAIKLGSEVNLGRPDSALEWLWNLERLESSGVVTEDASEARWCVDALQKVVEREASSELTSRAERLITAINERLMSTYPLLASRVPVNQDNIWEELEAAGYTTMSPLPEQVEQQPEQKKEEQPIQHGDDEMAETAGRLLEKVADNTSEKFQNSQFLELMRRLRDREVRVEGDKMVEVSSARSPSPLPATASASAAAPTVPEVDPMILNHAAQDLGIPFDSEQEFSGLADEISDQFRNYNINAPYHR